MWGGGEMRTSSLDYWDEPWVSWRDRAYYGGNRKKAMERDDLCCRHCDCSEFRLVVHHIDPRGRRHPYSLEKDNREEMLITLCNSCHTKLHNCMQGFIDRHYKKTHK